MAYTAVAYLNYGGYEEGIAFGPEFSTEEECWEWLHDMGPTPCDVPHHDSIEVEPVAVF